MDKSRIIRVLEEMADILEISDANPFQIMAYRKGAIQLGDWEGDLARAVEAGTLTEISGIGKGLAAVISDLHGTGHSEEHDRLRALYPEKLLELLSVPRLGPKRIRVLHEQLGVDSLDALQNAAEQQRIRTLKGFGAKSEQTIIHGVERARRHGRRFR